ncbi:lysophospholipid transporter LplT [Thauera sp.]|uniref:lysophospholipid transporter LplT n=1 Tax=Thauera sp. TaxID=1905334 RepID=UPI000E85A1A3|nr:lysophospholipid transporter LplT [Thauera sp.]HAY09069.1 lysophospholipid transporter LplT [Thauera sp.]HNR59798.1 lysophospholipid transporter LplT [Thauera sp.]HNS92560.1 lysophospholipid transporter LplT [Thauera sp.]HRJ22446.1 lysophospholipid transporter LplT [Thauera sp.]HRK09450.1 lysophospholipid transporter LplT [Thauera sp.]
MPLGFYIIMAAQFFSALADNALLIISIAMLRDMAAPSEFEPLLKLFFTLSYVGLAAFVGAFADSMPKWRVMLISNTIKIGGCLMLFLGSHPLLAYAVIGLGAAAYSPAKYGILTEYLPHRLLVVANGWIEGLTVGAIIIGTVMGGIMIRDDVSAALMGLGLPFADNAFEAAVFVIGSLYLAAAVFNMFIPDTGVDHKPLKNNPIYLFHDFNHCLRLLWRDKLGQISLAVTTLFWGAGATLQFIVIKWAEHNLGMSLSEASMLQGVVALGIAAGSILAARYISLRQSVRVIPLGIAMGIVVTLMIGVTEAWIAMALMVVVGGLAGFFVVPMNALLQHRGHILMGAGHSIAVQNFNENLSILVMTGTYALLIMFGLSINTVIALFGIFVAGTMLVVKRRHEANQREFDNVALLEDRTH